MQIRDLSAPQFARLSALLDDSVDLGPEERAQWLARVELEDRQLGELLRKVLSTQSAQSHSFMGSPEALRHHLAALIQDEDSLVGRRIGAYRVLSLLGRGGMGSVWLAERADGLFSRRVALKLVHPALTGRAVSERFAREREILANLNHPNIARLLDAGIVEQGQPYLALEYVAGTPITTHCDRARLSVVKRLQLFLQVLSAVQYAHANLVIHRDLKPSNILVTQDGEVRLLDFGIAKLLTGGEARETELTRFGGLALTPDYASPEQIVGGTITTAADVYALGVMLYELLTGERPYRLKRFSSGALEEAILQVDPVPPGRVPLTDAAADARATTPKKLARLLRGELDNITFKTLRKLPAERYATANAFAEDIGRFLRGEPVLAQRHGVVSRAVKFARRHRIAIGVSATLLLTLAAGLAATSHEARVAAMQRDAAVEANSRLLTQAAAARLREADVPAASSIMLEVLRRSDGKQRYSPDALSVFQEARAADALLLAMTGHTDRVRFAAFSPDGRRVVTASDDKTARVWDALTGRELAVLTGHTDGVRCAQFSPDGSRIVTASWDGTARIWNAATGQPLVLLQGHTGRVRAANFSRDGRLVVTASWDRTARIWDAVAGRQLRVLGGHSDIVTSAAFSPDGRQVVTASYDKTARVWDVATGHQVQQLNGHTDLVASAAFSSDASHIVTASYDRTARVWDVATGRAVLVLRTNRLWTAVFSPDDLRLLTGSDDKTARIWDAATGQELATLSGHRELVASATFSPDGRQVLTASPDKTARIWDVTPHLQMMVLSGHTDRVSSATFSPDGRAVLTSSYDKTARTWDLTTGKQIVTFSGHGDWVWSAAFAPDGRRIVTSSTDRTARIWDVVSGRQLLQLEGHTQLIASAMFSPDGKQIATGSDDRTVRLWDALTGRQVLRLDHPERVWTARFSPNGHVVVTTAYDGTARVWDAATGRPIAILSGHTGLVASAAFSHDGSRIVTASSDRTARIWDVATARQIVMLQGHGGALQSAVFSPDDRRVATASEDKTARIWDATNGQQLAVIVGHTDAVGTVAFSPNGAQLVTASDDKTARVWDSRSAPLAAQIRWTAAAQFDELSDTERLELGLASTGSRNEPRRAGAGRERPEALSRSAVAEESAASQERDLARRNAHLLEAFRDYSAAAELARRDGLPDDVWQDWRYRRASLARILARDGLMEQVAETYASVIRQ